MINDVIWCVRDEVIYHRSRRRRRRRRCHTSPNKAADGTSLVVVWVLFRCCWKFIEKYMCRAAVKCLFMTWVRAYPWRRRSHISAGKSASHSIEHHRSVTLWKLFWFWRHLRPPYMIRCLLLCNTSSARTFKSNIAARSRRAVRDFLKSKWHINGQICRKGNMFLLSWHF